MCEVFPREFGRGVVRMKSCGEIVAGVMRDVASVNTYGESCAIFMPCLQYPQNNMEAQ